MEKEIVISNDMSEIIRVTRFIEDISISLSLPSYLGIRIALSTEEAANSIIHHAYPAKNKGKIKFKASYINGELTFLIIDDGISFDPTFKTETEGPQSIKQILNDELSIFLIYRIMDEVTYHTVDHQNYLMLTKRINNIEETLSSMNTNICKMENTIVLTLEGRLDTANAREFEKTIQPILTGSEPEVIVNCEELTFISSSGLRSFILLQKNLLAHNRKLVLEGMRPEIRKIFDMTGCSSVFTIL